ncbi:trithorax group protein osa [Hippoglossus stenolepis]|uniref:trithorax group protein osa n=1 Tax=Hippoglossus stenolepis TaxID=195615 RepID=UPI001FAEDD67|nr:trithorax group protein osa [Hippoglossus stenolepis]
MCFGNQVAADGRSAAAVCRSEELLPQCEISSAPRLQLPQSWSLGFSSPVFYLLHSVLLVWLLSELDSSTSFPAQARGSVPPEAWQSLRKRYNTRSRPPLQYIQALREANRRKPYRSPLPSAQLPNERDLSNQNQRLDPTSRFQSAPPRNRPIAESNLRVPLLTFQSQEKETRPTTNRGQSERPISAGIHLNGPSRSSSPSTHFASSVPTSHTAQSSETPSRNIGNAQPTEQNKPLSLGYSSQYTAPTEQISQGQSPIIAKLDLTKYPTRSLPISYYPQQYANDHFVYSSAQRNPTGNVDGEGQGGQTVSSNPTYVRPPLVDYVSSRYDGSQMNPTTVYGEDQSGQTVSPNPVYLSQYERFPSGLYNAGQGKPGGNGYGTHQTLLPVRTRPASTSEQYSSRFKPSSGQRQETVPPSHQVQPLSTPIVAPSEYEVPFPSYNGEVPTTAYGPVDVGQLDFSSSSGPSSRGQSGPAALPDHLTSFGSSENVYSSTGYQTQTGSSGRGKPSYTKLLLDIENELDEGPGQTDYLAAPARSPLYDGYPGQNMAETLVRNPSPLPRPMNSMRQDQQSGPLGSTNTNNPVYVRPPIRDSGVNPYASNPQNQMLPEQLQVSDVVPQQANVASYVGTSAGSVPTYLAQQPLPNIYFYAMLVALGQHPVPWQPSRDPSTEHYSLNPPVFQIPFIQNTAPYNPHQFQVHEQPRVGVS